MTRLILFPLIALLIATTVYLSLPKPAEEPQPSGTAAIGGDVPLLDARGKSFNTSRLKGKWSLVFFGFTHCPDICPTSLATIGQALEQLGDAASTVTPVFITVDPARDTPDALRAYLGFYDSRIIGLTGSEEQIVAAARAYKVYFARQPADAEGGYSVDHSGYMYLMNPDGTYHSHYPFSIAPSELAGAIRKAMGR